jgi:hypothetical protein
MAQNVLKRQVKGNFPLLCVLLSAPGLLLFTFSFDGESTRGQYRGQRECPMYIDHLCSDIPVTLLSIGGTDLYRRSLSSKNPPVAPTPLCPTVDDLCTTEVCMSRPPTPSHTKVFITQGQGGLQTPETNTSLLDS